MLKKSGFGNRRSEPGIVAHGDEDMKSDELALQAGRGILLIRGMKVMLSHDLAELYEVETKALNRAVKRNVERFPKDFMFQLSDSEWNDLKRQIGTSSSPGKNTEIGFQRCIGFITSEE
jgi:hypothetical protein